MTTIKIDNLMTVGVAVADQERALDFYVGTLGLEKRRDVPAPQTGGRWIEVAPDGSAVTIALEPAREGHEAGGETGIRLATADAGEVHEQLQARGIDVGELLLWPGVPPMFALRDPDGNRLEVVQAA